MGKQSFWRMLQAASFLLTAGTAQAASITVDVGCTLADAITAANTDTATGSCMAGAGEDTIILQQDVLLAAALPEITSIVIIEGDGHFISGNHDENVGRVLYITDTGNLTLNETTVKDGKLPSSSSSFGGGIYNEGTFTLTSSTVNGNKGNAGGGIYNKGTFTLTSSIVSGNTAGTGGGILNQGLFTMTNSTVSGNTSSSTISGGGGLFNMDSGTVTLTSSIISGNTADNSKEVYNSGTTVNAASFNIFGHSGEANWQAFYGFTPSGSDVNATSNGSTPTALSAILNTTLTDNGGFTQTHALVAGSPAIDLDGTCNGGKITTDQRGYNRPVGSGCDAGAFEYSAAVVTPFKVTASVGTGGSIFPAGEQTVNDGETISFTVTPATGYTAASAVGGTCPQGSWNGSTYTTGAIKADCSVVFSFTANGTASKTNMAPIYKLLLKR